MMYHAQNKLHFSTEKNVWVVQTQILSLIRHLWLVLIVQKTHTLSQLCIVAHLAMKKIKTPHKHRNQKKMGRKTKPSHNKNKIKPNKTRKRCLTKTRKTKLQEMKQKIKLDKLQMWQTMKLHKISHKLQTPQTLMFSTK